MKVISNLCLPTKNVRQQPPAAPSADLWEGQKTVKTMKNKNSKKVCKIIKPWWKSYETFVHQLKTMIFIWVLRFVSLFYWSLKLCHSFHGFSLSEHCSPSSRKSLRQRCPNLLRPIGNSKKHENHENACKNHVKSMTHPKTLMKII